MYLHYLFAFHIADKAPKPGIEKEENDTCKSSGHIKVLWKVWGGLEEHCITLKRHYSWSVKRMANKLTTRQPSLLGGERVCRDRAIDVPVWIPDLRVWVPRNPGPSSQWIKASLQARLASLITQWATGIAGGDALQVTRDRVVLLVHTQYSYVFSSPCTYYENGKEL